MIFAILTYQVTTKRAKSLARDRLRLQESPGIDEKAIADVYEEMSKYKVLKESIQFVDRPLGG